LPQTARINLPHLAAQVASLKTCFVLRWHDQIAALAAQGALLDHIRFADRCFDRILLDALKSMR
jgi:hypothetical protein